jgi:hypothetical protein
VTVLTLTTFALATAMGGGLLLVAAGLGHIRHFGLLRATLVTQAVLPYHWHRLVAHALVVTEVVVGVAAFGAGFTPHSASGVVFAAEGVLYTALLGYTAVVRIHRPTAPCGCFADQGHAFLSSVVRTAVLTIGAWGAVLSGTQAAARPMPLLVAGAAGIAVLAYVIPIALRTVNAEEASWTH